MNFSPQSRIWIYLSSREFSIQEVKEINRLLTEFCTNWAAHGNNLNAKGEVLHNRFIVLMVDETQAGASGCSIDTSVHFIQQLEKQFDTQLLNRLLFAFRQNESISVAPLFEIETLIKEGTLTHSTIVFNTSMSLKADFDDKFETSLDNSWLMKRASKFLLLQKES